MTSPAASIRAVALCLLLAACAETRVTDHAFGPQPSGVGARSGRTLLVVETALPASTPDRERRAAEVTRLVREHLAAAATHVAAPDRDDALLAQARAEGLDTVSVVRVEDYAREGNLYVALAVPPVSWDTRTVVSLRVRMLDARTGATLTDVRRDRTRGGLFTARTEEDLPAELEQALQSLFPAQG